MATFDDQLSHLISEEAAAAHNDADRLGAMIERMARALGFTIAIASRGDGKTIDTMIEGATAYAHEEAVDKSRFGQFMSGMSRKSRG